MKILVTGGAGYIGSHACKALALAGHEPVVFDNLSSGHRKLVRWGDFIHGDILDTSALTTAMRAHAVDGVIHFAALADVGESVREPEGYYNGNVAGSLSVLQAMRLAGVDMIVVSGSYSVHGQPDGAPIREDLPFQPQNPYARTKVAMEWMLSDFAQAYGLRGAVLRYANAAGADADGECGELHDPETHLIPRLLMAAAGRIPALRIFGDDYPTEDGSCVRDYVHVTDLADAHVKALDRLAAGDASLALNLGSGTGYSVKSILSEANNVLGKPVPHAFGPRRPGDPAWLVADPAKAERILDWRPRRSDLPTILSTAAAWHARAGFGGG